MTNELQAILTELRRGDYELSDLWDQLDSVRYKVLDDAGVNVDNASVRHFSGDMWLYVDDVDGYELLEENELEGLFLSLHSND